LERKLVAPAFVIFEAGHSCVRITTFSGNRQTQGTSSDDRYDYGEERIYAIGMVNGLEITVIYVDLDADERRIISAWRSEPHERREYWKSIKRLSQ
jgi:uncharacterized DUF497 family protein